MQQPSQSHHDIEGKAEEEEEVKVHDQHSSSTDKQNESVIDNNVLSEIGQASSVPKNEDSTGIDLEDI